MWSQMLWCHRWNPFVKRSQSQSVEEGRLWCELLNFRDLEHFYPNRNHLHKAALPWRLSSDERNSIQHRKHCAKSFTDASSRKGLKRFSVVLLRSGCFQSCLSCLRTIWTILGLNNDVCFKFFHIRNLHTNFICFFLLEESEYARFFYTVRSTNIVYNFYIVKEGIPKILVSFNKVF